MSQRPTGTIVDDPLEMIRRSKSNPVSVPSGFPEQEPLPSRNWWEPAPEQAPLPSRQSFPDINQYPSQTPAMDAYYDTVTNPPVRRPNSALRMVGTGLLSALQDSTGPKSRVPLYNKNGKVVGSREAGFWESLGNNPFDVDEASHIADIPFKSEVTDWKLREEGLGKAATLESNYPAKQALARQRDAAALAAPQRADAATLTAQARAQDAQTRARVASLKDLPDSERLRLLQEGRVSLQDIKDAASMDRVNVQQAGATTRTGMQQTGATTRTGMQVEGRHEDVAAQQAGGLDRAEVIAGASAGRANQAGAGMVTMKGPDGVDRTYRVNPDNPTELVPMTIQGAPGVPVPRVEKTGTPTRGKESADQTAKLASVREIAARTTNALEELLTPDKTALRDDVKWGVGGSSYAEYVPFIGGRGSQVAAGTERIERAKNLLTLELMQEIRRISPSGATGLGNMSNDDRKTIEKASSILSKNLPEDQFLQEIKDLLPALAKIQEPTPGTTTHTAPGAISSEERVRRARAARAAAGGK